MRKSVGYDEYLKDYAAYRGLDPAELREVLDEIQERSKGMKSLEEWFRDVYTRQDQGFVTEAVVNYVALLGWCPSGNQEIFSLEELVKEFDYHHMSKSPAVFDITKLKWMNGEYLKAMDEEKFYEMAKPYIQEVVTKDYDLRKIANLVKTRIEIFPDIREQIDFFEELPAYDTAMYLSLIHI